VVAASDARHDALVLEYRSRLGDGASLLMEFGWEYVQTIVWDKGVRHIAGNVNGDTIRQFPVVTEICVLYRRTLAFPSSNTACGVKNAATRKYLTQDWLWYFPPTEEMMLLVEYANEHGDPNRRPYYSLDGDAPVTREQWAALRHPWTHQHAVTNVWSHPPLAGTERFKGNGKRSAPRS
jgi:site-specific DNA-methyltransferase (adenine-specific)